MAYVHTHAQAFMPHALHSRGSERHTRTAVRMRGCEDVHNSLSPEVCTAGRVHSRPANIASRHASYAYSMGAMYTYAYGYGVALLEAQGAPSCVGFSPAQQ